MSNLPASAPVLKSRDVDDFRMTAMLCDAVHVSAGKFYILGGGWNQLPAQQTPTAIAIVLSIPWGEANKQHVLEAHLVDENGIPFSVKGAAATDEPFVMRVNFESGRPPGTRPGTPLGMNVGLAVPPLAYSVGRYEWRFTINGQARDEWRLPFQVNPPAQNVFYPGKS
jgi:hypothetical protein